MKITINTPSTLIINAIKTYLEVVKNGKHIDYDTVWLKEDITVPNPAVTDTSNIMTDDPDENIDIIHDYLNCFARYE